MDTLGAGAVLVTGGAGFIGSHTALALKAAGRTPVTFDNLSTGHRQAVQFGPFIHGDIRDEAALVEAMTEHRVTAVIHFASLIEVGASVARPDLFYEHNVRGTMTLLAAMRRAGVPRLVFSSSAAVYGEPRGADPLARLQEDAPKQPSSPYGDTKLACERMIAAHCAAFGLTGVALRYFNAAGGDPQGRIGEAHAPETHLIPLALDAALGRRGALTVFGADYPTPDGSCLRDYVHVQDLAAAHVLALGAKPGPQGFQAINIGTGRGHSVLEVVEAVARTLGRPVPHAVGERRPGDPASLVADAALAGAALNWTPRRSSLEQMVADAALWRSQPRFGLAPLQPEPLRAAAAA